MSLLVWLPLISDCENKGLSDLKFSPISSNTSSISNGKIGTGCYYNDSNTGGGILSDIPLKSLGSNVSMFAWVKLDSFNINPIGIGGTHTILGRDYPAATGMGFNIIQNPVNNNIRVVSVNTGDGVTRTWQNYYGTTAISAGVWYHIGFTYDGNYIKIYVNGKLDAVHTYTGQSNPADYVHAFSWSMDGTIGTPTIFPHYNPIGSINDFRIYDHTLSSKEVRLLSQGLVSHYQLKGVGRTNYLKGSGQFTMQNPLVRNSSDVSHMNDSYVYHTNVLSATILVDGTYTWVVETDGIPNGHNTSGTSASSRYFSLWLQNTSTGNHYCWSNYGIGSDGKAYGSVTIPAGTYNVRTNLYAADNVNYTVKFWSMKLIQGTYTTNDTWCPNAEDPLYHQFGFGLGDEPDCSGFGNNGVKNDTFEVISDSARYGSCYMLNGSNNIESYLDTNGWTDATVSAWIKPNSYEAGSLGDDRSCIFIGGFYVTLTTSGRIATYCYGKSNAGYHQSNTVIPLNQWTHIAAVWDNTSGQHKIYINGNCDITVESAGVADSVWHQRKYIGQELWWAENHDNKWHRSFHGAISDVRLYATALSGSDIADLCKNSASLSNDGTLFAYDFREDKRNTIDKDGIVSTSSFNDKSVPLYDMETKALEDGSTWAKISSLDVTNEKTFFANASEVAKCTNKPNRYSRMGDVDKYNIESKLPTGYTELKYIESSGTQFIDAGFAAPNGCIMDFSWEFTQIGGYVIGAHDLVDPYGRAYVNVQSGNQWVVGTGDADLYTYNYPSANIKYEICASTVKGDSYMEIGGSRVAYSTDASIRASSNVYLFSNYYLEYYGYSGARAIGKMYYAKFYLPDKTLVRHFIPCKNPSGSVGMYDLVENKFYANSGTGSFIEGGLVGEYEFMLTYPTIKKTVPAGYTELEYIESTGTQWINTGVYGNAKWEFDIEFKTNISNRQLMGYGGDGGEYWGLQSADNKYGVHSPNTIGYGGSRDTIVHDFSGNGNTLWVQNQILGVGSDNVSSKQYQLFAIMSILDYACHAKLYRCKCIQNGSLIRDFVPAMRNSDGAIGLVDIVNNAFYTNAGSGVFYCNYTWLDYLESSGAQYINTGFNPNSNTRIVIKALLKTPYSIYGVNQSGAAFNMTGSSANGGVMYYYWGNGGASLMTNYFDQVHVFEQDKNICRVDGMLYHAYTYSDWSATCPIFLFGRNNGSALNDSGIARIYYCQIYDNGVLVRDMYPCLNNGVAGMYDRVTKSFYGNSGSGSFKVGYKNNEYQWLDYIESSGTQYINTGWTPPANMNCEIQVEFMYTGNSVDQTIFGVEQAGTSAGLTLNAMVGTNLWQLGVNNNWSSLTHDSCTTNKKFNAIVKVSSGATKFILDGTVLMTNTQTTYSPAGSMTIFRTPASGREYPMIGRVYSFKIYDNGSLVRDLVPCISQSGEIGMYDKITNKFFENKGTGNFIAGTTKESLPLYNRWIQASSPNASSVSGFKPITTSWTAHNSGIRKHGSDCVYNCDSGGTWYAPVGQTNIWEGGIPAADGTMQTKTELWVRTDRFNDANKLKIYNGSIVAADYIEI